MRPPLPIKTASTTLRALFEIAQRRGVTYEQLAEALKASQSLVYSWKAGRHTPSIIYTEELAAVLGCRIVVVQEEEQ